MKKLLLLLLLLICNTAAAQNIMQFTGGNYVFVEQDKLTFNLRHDLFLNRRWVYDKATDSAVAEFVVNLPIKTAHSSSWHTYTADNGYGTMQALLDDGNGGLHHGRYGQTHQGGLQPASFINNPARLQNAKMGGAFAESYFIRSSSIFRQKRNHQLSRLAIPYTQNISFHSSVGANLDFDQNLHHTVIQSRQRHLAAPRIIPALLWGVRVVGFAGRMVLPGAVTACMRNLKCTAGVAGTAIGLAPPCAINMVSGVLTNTGVFPPGVCNRIEQAGYAKDSEGDYYRPAGYRISSVYLDSASNQRVAFSQDVSGLEEGKQVFIERACKSFIGHETAGGPIIGYRIVRMDQNQDGSYTMVCGVYPDRPGAFGEMAIWGTIRYEQAEKLTMIDLEQFIGEDFKDDPTPYMNDKGEVGEALRGAIRLRKADLNHSGNGVLTLTSAPYRNSQGQTVQDRVTIGRPQTETRPNPSGNVSQPAPGISNTYNTVNIQHINRPDKEAESQPGENNSPNNGANIPGGSGNPSSGDQGGNHCRDNPQSVGCMGMGDVDGNANPINIPTVDSGIGYRPDNFLPDNGVCPAPKQVQILGFTYEFSYYWLCEFAAMIRAVFIILAGVVAARIVFKS